MHCPHSRFTPIVLALGALVAPAAAIDNLLPAPGAKGVQGDIKKVTSTVVTIEQNSVAKEVPVNEIRAISFGNEPTQISSARKQMETGNFEDALTNLEKLTDKDVEGAMFVRQERDFMVAYCKARVALAGNGDVREAGTAVVKFAAGNTDSYRIWTAQELAGDLLVAMGNNAKAVDFYQKLGLAPWPDYKMRAATAMGRALLADNKPADAAKQFEAALEVGKKAGVTTPLIEAQRLAATLGVARCQAESGKSAEAAAAVKDVIKKAHPENADLHAQAYNTLGNIFLKTDKKAARMAFLRTHLLYASNSQAHAEALWHLETLWKETGKVDRANEYGTLLRTHYKNSPWATKGQGS